MLKYYTKKTYLPLFSLLFLLINIFTSVAATLTVTNHNDAGPGSLRAQISAAVNGDIIIFSASLNGDSIVLTSGQIMINKDLTIQGPGADRLIISGNKNSRIFEVTSGTSLFLSGLRFKNGKASGAYPSSYGGAIYCEGYLDISHCAFTNNKADSCGGAIALYLGVLVVNASSFCFNFAGDHGGAISNIAGYAELLNSTLSNNTAVNRGGAFYNQSITPVTTISDFTNCSIVQNSSGKEGGGIACTFLVYTDTSKIIMESTLVGANSAGLWAEDIYRGYSSRCKIESHGFNLISNADSVNITATTGDIMGNYSSPVDPGIGPLGFYGGPTETHVLLCNSPAYNMGSIFSTLNIDQRGQPRPFDGVIDIGAFESQQDISVPYVNLGPDLDTCYGVKLQFSAGTTADSVNWFRTNGTLLKANEMNLELTIGKADSIYVEVFSPARCVGFDTLIIKYKDFVKPVIQNCPSNIVIKYDSLKCNKVVTWTPPTATDNCYLESFVSDFSPGDTFPVGVTNVTYIAKDPANNSATCSFKVTVFDPDKPILTCPSNISVNKDPASCYKTVNYTLPAGFDICPGVNVSRVAGLGPGASFPVGTTTEKYLVTDASGNKDSCSFTVTIVDNEPPVITCPRDTILNNNPGVCGAMFNYTSPVGIDSCPGAMTSRIAGLGSGVVFPVGETTEVYEVKDANNNSATCSFKVTVNDTEKPVITCPPKVETCDTIVTYDAPTGTDNCSGSLIKLISGIGRGGDFPGGTTYDVYEVSDLALNTAVCTVEVVVHPYPTVDAGHDTTVFYGDELPLNPVITGGASYLWRPGTYLDDSTKINPVAKPLENITYYIYVKNGVGCESYDSIKVNVVFELLIPTAFTPDKDGKNDTWYIKGIRRFPNCEVKVFNIWGGLVFEKSGYEGDWDGTYNGKDLPVGTYYYIVDLKDGKNVYQGNLTIIR